MGVFRTNRQCFFFSVKRKDTREHFGFENVHVLNFASRADFGEMFTGKKKNHGWNFWKCSRALFTGNSIFLDLFTGRKKVSRATFYRNDSQPASVGHFCFEINFARKVAREKCSVLSGVHGCLFKIVHAHFFFTR